MKRGQLNQHQDGKSPKFGSSKTYNQKRKRKLLNLFQLHLALQALDAIKQVSNCVDPLNAEKLSSH